MSARIGDVEFAAQEPDLFECLSSIRRKLEEIGLLLCCQGARPNVHPSGMSRQMSGGRKAYAWPAGGRATQDDLVDILDHADCQEVSTLDEQSQFLKNRYGWTSGAST